MRAAGSKKLAIIVRRSIRLETTDELADQLIYSRRDGGIALRGRSREKRRTDVGTTLVRRFYSDTFRVNFRGLVVFVVECVPSFCCVPDPPRRNVVFACGYAAPFFSLKSSNFVFY